MHLDLQTLLAADSFVIAITGIVMLGAAYRGAASKLAKWWGVGSLLVAAATGILAAKGGLPDLSTRVTVATLLNIASVCEWATARSARNAGIPLPAIFAGPLLWIMALSLPALGSAHLQVALLWAIGAAYSYAGAIEMWKGRDETLAPRWALFALLAFDGSFNIIGAITGLMGETTSTTLPPLTISFGLVYFEALIIWVGGAFFVLALGADRTESRLKEMAYVDPLTGVASRRAFMTSAAAALAAAQRAGNAFSLIEFDLDHFKLVNDTCGHAAGDRSLQQFGQIAQQMLRPGDFVGRIGGEEFVVALPKGTAAVAYIIAERIRAAFAHAINSNDGRPIGASVSAGIAEALPGEGLDEVLKAADDALYIAKARGRNRVERAEGRFRSAPSIQPKSLVRRTVSQR